jgi:hypothetical protein
MLSKKTSKQSNKNKSMKTVIKKQRLQKRNRSFRKKKPFNLRTKTLNIKHGGANYRRLRPMDNQNALMPPTPPPVDYAAVTSSKMASRKIKKRKNKKDEIIPGEKVTDNLINNSEPVSTTYPLSKSSASTAKARLQKATRKIMSANRSNPNKYFNLKNNSENADFRNDDDKPDISVSPPIVQTDVANPFEFDDSIKEYVPPTVDELKQQEAAFKEPTVKLNDQYQDTFGIYNSNDNAEQKDEPFETDPFSNTPTQEETDKLTAEFIEPIAKNEDTLVRNEIDNGSQSPTVLVDDETDSITSTRPTEDSDEYNADAIKDDDAQDYNLIAIMKLKDIQNIQNLIENLQENLLTLDENSQEYQILTDKINKYNEKLSTLQTEYTELVSSNANNFSLSSLSGFLPDENYISQDEQAQNISTEPIDAETELTQDPDAGSDVEPVVPEQEISGVEPVPEQKNIEPIVEPETVLDNVSIVPEQDQKTEVIEPEPIVSEKEQELDVTQIPELQNSIPPTPEAVEQQEIQSTSSPLSMISTIRAAEAVNKAQMQLKRVKEASEEAEQKNKLALEAAENAENDAEDIEAKQAAEQAASIAAEAEYILEEETRKASEEVEAANLAVEQAEETKTEVDELKNIDLETVDGPPSLIIPPEEPIPETEAEAETTTETSTDEKTDATFADSIEEMEKQIDTETTPSINDDDDIEAIKARLNNIKTKLEDLTQNIADLKSKREVAQSSTETVLGTTATGSDVDPDAVQTIIKSREDDNYKIMNLTIRMPKSSIVDEAGRVGSTAEQTLESIITGGNKKKKSTRKHKKNTIKKSAKKATKMKRNQSNHKS